MPDPYDLYTAAVVYQHMLVCHLCVGCLLASVSCFPAEMYKGDSLWRLL